MATGATVGASVALGGSVDSIETGDAVVALVGLLVGD
jgi:hypothetical protein